RIGETDPRHLVHLEVLGPRGNVGEQLEPPPRAEALQTIQMAVPLHSAPLEPGREGEVRRLLVAVDRPLQLDSPDLLVRWAEPQLAEGDAHLDGPASVGAVRSNRPDGVP